MDFLNHALAWLQSAQGSAAAAAVIVEFVLRLVKSDKPLSILHLVAAGAHVGASVIGAAADLLDKVLPQNLTPPAGPAV